MKEFFMSQRSEVLNHPYRKLGNKWVYDAKLSLRENYILLKIMFTLRKIGRRYGNMYHVFAFRITQCLINVLFCIVDWSFRKVLIVHSFLCNNHRTLESIISRHAVWKWYWHRGERCKLARSEIFRNAFEQNTTKQNIV